MKYDLDRLVDRRGTNCSKWEFMRDLEPEATEDTLAFWLADMDFACAPPILAALHKRIEREVFGYSKLNAAYYQSVCRWYQHRFGWQIDPGDVLYSPGVIPALGFLIDILTQPGDSIIIQRPVYGPFANAICSHDRQVVNNALIHRQGRYEIDFDDLERKIRQSQAKMMILCNPHNPTGRVWTMAELREIGRIAMAHQVVIVADEIHCDLVRRHVRHTPMAMAFPEYRQGIITATAPSKTFNLAGLQLANIFIHDPELKQKWQFQIKTKHGVWLPNPLSIVAAQAAFDEGEEWLEQVIDYLDANIAFTQAFLREKLPKVQFVPPEGTYLLWLDFRAYGYTREELHRVMIREAGVFWEDGAWFGDEGAGFLRVNCACPRQILERGLNQMAAAVARTAPVQP